MGAVVAKIRQAYLLLLLQCNKIGSGEVVVVAVLAAGGGSTFRKGCITETCVFFPLR